MPYLRLPNGRWEEVPEGVTYEQALKRAQEVFPKLYAKPELAEEGFLPSLKSGIEGLKSRLSTAVAPIFGQSDESARKAFERSQAARSEIAKSPSWEDVTEAQKKYGLFGGSREDERGGLGQFLRFTRANIAESLPDMGLTMAGARLGAGVGSFGGPIGTVAGGIAGGVLGALPSFVGGNVERQMEEQEKAGVKTPLDYKSATAAAAGQSALNMAETVFVLGRLGVGKALGDLLLKLPAKNAETVLAKAAEQSLLKAAGKGAAKGILTELPTEIAQQVLERKQAGLDLLGEDALKEYEATAAGVVGMGGAMGVAGGISGRSTARDQLQELREARGAAEAEQRAAAEAQAKQAAEAQAAEQKQAFQQAMAEQRAPYDMGMKGPLEPGAAEQGQLFKAEAPAGPAPVAQAADEADAEDRARTVFDRYRAVSSAASMYADQMQKAPDVPTYNALQTKYAEAEKQKQALEAEAKQLGVPLQGNALSDDARAALQKKLKALETAVQKHRERGEPVPQALMAKIADAQSQMQAGMTPDLFGPIVEGERSAEFQNEMQQRAAEQQPANIQQDIEPDFQAQQAEFDETNRAQQAQEAQKQQLANLPGGISGRGPLAWGDFQQPQQVRVAADRLQTRISELEANLERERNALAQMSDTVAPLVAQARQYTGVARDQAAAAVAQAKQDMRAAQGRINALEAQQADAQTKLARLKELQAKQAPVENPQMPATPSEIPGDQARPHQAALERVRAAREAALHELAMLIDTIRKGEFTGRLRSTEVAKADPLIKRIINAVMVEAEIMRRRNSLPSASVDAKLKAALAIDNRLRTLVEKAPASTSAEKSPGTAAVVRGQKKVQANYVASMFDQIAAEYQMTSGQLREAMKADPALRNKIRERMKPVMEEAQKAAIKQDAIRHGMTIADEVGGELATLRNEVDQVVAKLAQPETGERTLNKTTSGAGLMGRGTYEKERAEARGDTHPTLSGQLKRLREYVNTRITDVLRSMEPSPETRAVLEDMQGVNGTRESLNLADAIVEKLRAGSPVDDDVRDLKEQLSLEKKVVQSDEGQRDLFVEPAREEREAERQNAPVEAARSKASTAARKVAAAQSRVENTTGKARLAAAKALADSQKNATVAKEAAEREERLSRQPSIFTAIKRSSNEALRKFSATLRARSTAVLEKILQKQGLGSNAIMHAHIRAILARKKLRAVYNKAFDAEYKKVIQAAYAAAPTAGQSNALAKNAAALQTDILAARAAYEAALEKQKDAALKAARIAMGESGLPEDSEVFKYLTTVGRTVFVKDMGLDNTGKRTTETVFADKSSKGIGMYAAPTLGLEEQLEAQARWLAWVAEGDMSLSKRRGSAYPRILRELKQSSFSDEYKKTRDALRTLQQMVEKQHAIIAQLEARGSEDTRIDTATLRALETARLEMGESGVLEDSAAFKEAFEFYLDHTATEIADEKSSAAYLKALDALNDARADLENLALNAEAASRSMGVTIGYGGEVRSATNEALQQIQKEQDRLARDAAVVSEAAERAAERPLGETEVTALAARGQTRARNAAKRARQQPGRTEQVEQARAAVEPAVVQTRRVETRPVPVKNAPTAELQAVAARRDALSKRMRAIGERLGLKPRDALRPNPKLPGVLTARQRALENQRIKLLEEYDSLKEQEVINVPTQTTKIGEVETPSTGVPSSRLSDADREALGSIYAPPRKKQRTAPAPKLTKEEAQRQYAEAVKALRQADTEYDQSSGDKKRRAAARRAKLIALIDRLKETGHIEVTEYKGSQARAEAQNVAVREALSADRRKPRSLARDLTVRKSVTSGDVYDVPEAQYHAEEIFKSRGIDPRLGTAADTGIDTAEAAKVHARIAKNLPPHINLVYVDSLANAPQELQDAAAEAGYDHVKGAVLPDGTVVVIGDAHASAADLESTFAHELIGHYGVDGILGPDGMGDVSGELWAKGEQHVAEVATALGAFPDMASALAAARMAQSDEARLTYTSEMIARAAEGRKVSPTFADKVKQFIKSMIAAVRNWFRQHGMSESVKKDTKEIQQLIKQAYAEYGKTQPGAYVNTTGQVQFRAKAAPTPAGMSSYLWNKTNKMVAGQQRFADNVKANLMGLSFEVQFVDHNAALNYMAKAGAKANLITERAAMQLQYYLSNKDKAANWTRGTAENGPPVLREKTDAKGKYWFLETSEDPQAPTLVKAFRALAKTGWSDEQLGRGATMYLAAKRVLNSNGKITVDQLNFGKDAFTEAELQQFVAEIDAQPKVKAALDEFRRIYNAYNKGLIEFLVQTQAISKEQGALYAKDNDYIPFYRKGMGGNVELVISSEVAPLIVGNINEQPHLQELVGGDRAILDVFTTSLQNTNMLVNKAITNLAARNAAHTMIKLGVVKAIPIGEKKRKEAEAAGTTPKPAYIRPGSSIKGPNVLRFYAYGPEKDGKAEHTEWAVEIQTAGTAFDGIPEELVMRGIEGIKTTYPAALELMGLPAKAIRKAVILNPLYPIRQIVKDSLSGWATSGADFVPIVTPMKNLADAWGGKNKTYQEIERQGLGGGQLLSGSDRESMSVILRNIAGGKGSVAGLLGYLEGKSMMADAGMRMAAYNNFKKQGMNELETWVATNEMMDFNKRGASPSVYFFNALVPFFNAQIQSLNVLAKVMTGRATMQERAKIKEKFIKRGMAMAGVTMLYALAMQDDEAYKNATPEQRYSNWFVRTPFADEPLRIPIPFEFGLMFKAIPEAIVNVSMGKEEFAPVAKALASMAFNSVPSITPQAVKAPFEMLSGVDTFTWNSIESEKEKRLTPEQRYRDNTTELAKMLGSMGVPGVSPVKVDQFIKSVGSQTLLAAVSMGDVLLGDSNKPPSASMKESKLPLIGGLFQPEDAGGIINAVYDKMKDAEQHARTYAKLQAEDPAKADRFLERHITEVSLAKSAPEFRSQMQKLTAEEQNIRMSRDLAPREKRIQLDELRQYKIEIAKSFRDTIREMR